MFQSAPRSEERGDAGLQGFVLGRDVSIRAPLRGAGRRTGHSSASVSVAVSSRAPLRGAGRRFGGGFLGGVHVVSIRAPLRGAGRRIFRSGFATFACFNPRPAPRSGATVWTDIYQNGHPVSIRAPLRGAGRPSAVRVISPPCCFNPRPAPRSGATREGERELAGGVVSIRAPLRGAGRRTNLPVRAPYPLFQSAPRSEERGDRSRRKSLRVGQWFQSAPRSEERGDLSARSNTPPSACFNPRPAPRSGATGSGRYHLGGFGVSIRAPLRGAGRHWPVAASTSGLVFQSAPRSEERGDRAVGPYPHGGRCFNPRPAPRSGATVAIHRAGGGREVSIRAPLRGAGRQTAP